MCAPYRYYKNKYSKIMYYNVRVAINWVTGYQFCDNSFQFLENIILLNYF